jgi:hypothetical protein
MINRETYVELVHAMMYAVARGELKIGQISSVLFACAQQDTTEEVIDLTTDVRHRLTDWPHESKGRLISIECVRLTFQCQNIHGPCDRGQHQVMMTRIIGSNTWSPESVVSQHNFDQVVLEATQAQHNAGVDGSDPVDKFVVSRAKGSTLMGAFAEMFANEEDETIDSKIDDFRAELDALFPSNPQPRKEEGHESS